MNLLLLTTLVLSAYNPSAIEGRDFYNTANDIFGSTHSVMGAPTSYAYIASYDEPYKTNFDKINIIKVPYQLSIDFSRLEHFEVQIDNQKFYMSPLKSPTYEYHYFSMYTPFVPIGGYIEPFNYFISDDTDYEIRIPTTHETDMASDFMEQIVFMNSLAYSEEFESVAYTNGVADGYMDGAEDGYRDGYSNGLEEGIIAGDTPQEWRGLFGILRSGFNSIASIMQIPLFPGFTVGLLLFLPLIFGVAYAIIRLFIKGG